MSSILKALKKLESEKSQRDELSTAVASDILKTSRRNKRNSLVLVLFFCALFVAVAAAGYYAGIMTNKPVTIEPQSETATPVVADNRNSTKPLSESVPEAEHAPVGLPMLSGIVYQDDPASRIAIINDLPVMEGTLVEGYEIEMITPDRVVLSKDNSEYILLLEQE